jgi:hypothetical protein
MKKLTVPSNRMSVIQSAEWRKSTTYTREYLASFSLSGWWEMFKVRKSNTHAT